MSTPTTPAAPGPGSMLATLPAVVLDTETTGMDVRRDRVVSIAARRLRGATPANEPAFDVLVNPGVPIPATATTIHGIDDEKVAKASGFGEVFPAFRDFIDGHVVVGHHIAFDLAVIAAECARHGISWDPPPALDTRWLAQALNPHLPDGSLERIAQWTDVKVAGRHTALGDVETTAGIFAALVARLGERGIRTLAETRRFAREARPGGGRDDVAGGDLAGPADAPLAAGLSDFDSFPYRNLLADVMSSPPVWTEPGATLKDAAEKMTIHGISALLVRDKNEGAPAGIVTERDIVRAMARDDDAVGQPVSAVMSSPVVSLPADAPVYRAIGRLHRLGIRHLAVTEADAVNAGPGGAIVGVASTRDCLRPSASAPALADHTAVASADGLGEAMAKLPDVAAAMLDDAVSPRQIANVISAEYRLITARAAELAQVAMMDDFGPPPGSWCLLVLGSAGRGESLLAADQDNALIHDTSPEGDAWYAEFGKRIADLLDGAGIPYCTGGVMARNEPWRRTPGEWRAAVARWVGRAGAADLLNVDIFFDFRAVAGDPSLAAALDGEARALAADNRLFLRQMLETVTQLPAPTDFFGRLRTQGGRIDLKANGLLQLVSLARVAALSRGIADRGTEARLRAADENGILPPEDCASLIEIHEAILGLVVAQQVRDIEHGLAPSSRVELAHLSKFARKRLRTDLNVVGDIVSMLHATLLRD